MIVIGLTGSIAMGKSETARMFRRLGVPVFDSDAQVHRLLGPRGGAVKAVAAAFPGVVKSGAIDRQALGAKVFGDARARQRLEAILHPMVRRAQSRFLGAAARRRERLVVLDIPLLFETGAAARLDAVAVVSAPGFIQRQRVLARPGMSESKLAGILAAQMPDEEKRRRADFIIPTGRGKRAALDAVKALCRRLRPKRPRAWPDRLRQSRIRP